MPSMPQTAGRSPNSTFSATGATALAEVRQASIADRRSSPGQGLSTGVPPHPTVWRKVLRPRLTTSASDQTHLPTSPPGPAIFFTESSAGGALSNCAAATSVGDTHLATLNGLFYDFQASGDFVLAQVDPDFVVQARQVSGAPTWPDASVNSAVATRMGKTKVAVCLSPARLNVDGENTELGDGKSLSTPDGVDIWRTGNVYIITSQSGDSVRAEVNASWINVSVGLGHSPA